MTELPCLFDRTAVSAHRRRARTLPDGPALFLHDAVEAELQERLEEVNRSFTAPAVITGWPEVWRKGQTSVVLPDDDTLRLEPEASDLIVHFLSLHWATDPVGQLIQCRRALRPDGLFLGAFFGGRTLQELRAALTDAEVSVTGGLSPRVSPMGDIRDVGGLIQRAGLALPVADVMPLTVSYETPLHLMRDLRAMGETNALGGRLRHFSRRAVLLEAARLYSERHGDASGRITATFEIIILTGWAPAESQQKALRPGSASHRLADVLGTDEFSPKWSKD